MKRSFAASTLFRTLASGDDLELMWRSLDLRMIWAYKRGDRARGMAWVRDRAALFGHVALYPLRRLSRPKRRLMSRVLVWDPAAGRSDVRASRTYFIETSVGETPDFVGYDDTAPVCDGRTRVGLMARIWAHGLWIGVLGFFDLSGTRLSYIGRAFVQILDAAAVAECTDRLYTFSTAEPIAYVAATYLRDRLGVDVRLVPGNTLLYRWQRCCHLRAPIVLCSKAQEYELAYFAERRMNNAGPATYAGNEYALDLVGADTEPKVDLAYFSSGMWARIGGLARTDDLEGIRAMRYADNPYYRATEDILTTMTGIARERGCHMRIYLHPYERLLIAEHGIEPPYAGLADGELVTLDTSPGSSRPRMWEAKVAVSLQSTIIWERLDAGLPASFMYRFDDPEMNWFDPDAIGPFAYASFSDMVALQERIVDALDGP